MTREEERLNAAKQRYGEETEYLIAKTQAFLVGAKWADSCPPKGTSLIKWQTGEPKKEGYYLVTNDDGWISVANLMRKGNGELFWWGVKPIAWCKLSDVEPYKE